MTSYLSYHGTNRENTPLIVKDGFVPSAHFNDWLGYGVYFFINGISCPKNNAKEWGINQSWNGKIKKNAYTDYSVIEATIYANNILDLRNDEDQIVFNQLRDHILERYNKSKAKKKNALDSDTFICNAISKSLNLDVFINNLYIKTKHQRMNHINSRFPNTTVLCAKPKAVINQIKEIDHGKC